MLAMWEKTLPASIASSSSDSCSSSVVGWFMIIKPEMVGFETQLGGPKVSAYAGSTLLNEWSVLGAGLG